jgi:hypothetical protein
MIGGVLEFFSCLNVRITTFELEKTTFVVYLIMLSLLWNQKNNPKIGCMELERK